ncbi:hypothetical protein [Halopiger goleimassiliensis]|uniref:hypothetical protein n=1 Tax=Halopiger goleimassiliensis TaxID=1293048 RepID=UPI00067819A2|nr:hypothetical protein [Halopiger goleimassiliensis]
MSASDDEEIPSREVAYRLFAAEYDDASLSHTESDEERAPNYVVSPTGARTNRLFVVGTLTEVTDVNEEMVRARVVDPTGAFVVYAGQYQPDELAFLEQVDPPAFVAVTGKARTFEPEDGDRIYTSIRPESIALVDADTRDRWVVSAAEATLERIGTYAAAADVEASGDGLRTVLEDAGVERGLAAGIPLAQDHYGTTPSYLAALRDRALEAVAVVSGDREQVSSLDVAPDERSSAHADATFASLAEDVDLDLEAVESPTDAESTPATPDSDAVAAATASGGTDSHVGSADASASTASTSDIDDDLEAEIESATDDTESAVDTATDDATSEPPTGEDAADAEQADGVEEAPTDEADTEPTAGVDEEAEPTADEETPADLGGVDADEFGDGMYEMDDEERQQLEEEFGAEFTTGTEVDDPGEADIDVPEPDADADPTAEESGGETAESAADVESTDDDIGSPPSSSLEDDEPGGSDDLDAAPTSTLEAEEEPSDEAAEPDETAAEAEEASTDSDDEPAEAADADEEADEDDGTDAEDDAPAEDVDLQEYVVETMSEMDDGDGADREALVESVATDTGASADEVEEAIQDALMDGKCYEPDDDTLKAI